MYRSCVDIFPVPTHHRHMRSLFILYNDSQRKKITHSPKSPGFRGRGRVPVSLLLRESAWVVELGISIYLTAFPRRGGDRRIRKFCRLYSYPIVIGARGIWLPAIVCGNGQHMAHTSIARTADIHRIMRGSPRNEGGCPRV